MIPSTHTCSALLPRCAGAPYLIERRWHRGAAANETRIELVRISLSGESVTSRPGRSVATCTNASDQYQAPTAGDRPNQTAGRRRTAAATSAFQEPHSTANCPAPRPPRTAKRPARRRNGGESEITQAMAVPNCSISRDRTSLSANARRTGEQPLLVAQRSVYKPSSPTCSSRLPSSKANEQRYSQPEKAYPRCP